MQRKSGMTYEQIVDWLLDNAARDDGCLISHLRPNAKGYIPVGVGGRTGEKWRAHRLVYHILCAPLSKTDMVCHSCDVRACINPEHLFVGSAADNTRDMMLKGRGRNGGKTKVTPEIHAEMRRLRAQGFTNVRIGNILNLSHETVRSYLKGTITF